MNSFPIRLAILWHMHQPPYKSGETYLLPWARLHATKDYLDTARALERYPEVRTTINLVPSLLMQLQEYVSGQAEDYVLQLTRKPAFLLSEDDKHEIVRQFFQCNVERMIKPYPRYLQLYEHVDHRNDECRLDDLDSFSIQDWRDLQVWYLLTWIGPYSKEREPFHTMMMKELNFSEPEKLRLIEESLWLIGEIIPLWKQLKECNQIDLSVTPFYHPILPLLIDTSSAKESMPDVVLPTETTGWKDDAELQISGGIQFFEKVFGETPPGMWPSEGSISNETLELISKHKIQWAASDETVLRNSLGGKSPPLAHCFPWRYRTEHGDIHLFFRDYHLSDRIGFVYAGWEPEMAADDFVAHILNRRNQLIKEYGRTTLNEAALPIILDGENCWEYYEDNGRAFIEELYKRFTNSDLIETVTFTDLLERTGPDNTRTIESVRAGSWIGGDFGIWIGGEEENQAWDALAQARKDLMEARDQLSEQRFHKAYEELLAAEGSDWFWWYGKENTTVNDPLFDKLFRERLQRIYSIIGMEPPEELEKAIRQYTGKSHGGAMHRAEIE